MNPKFWTEICRISRELSDEDNILVVSHHDADGITACGIMIDLLRHFKKKSESMVIKQLDSTTIGKINNSDHDAVVFTDMGSGQFSLLRENKIRNFYIIDHHPPEKEYEKQINPHFYGYNGGLDISGAGLAYLVAKSLGHAKMAHLAVVGAVGDMQDSDGKLHSLNRIILQDGINLGSVKLKYDLRLFGRQSRTITQMLCYSSEPVIPGLTGDENACANFIQNLGINLRRDDNLWKHYVDLTHEERQKLTTSLYIHLLDSGIPEYIVQGMIGEVYTLLNEEKRTELRDAKEFATVLNACGRQGQPETGVKICLGDRGEEWGNARNLLQRHRKMLREGLEYLKSNPPRGLDNLYYFDAGDIIDENIIGVIAGMAYGARIISPDKPILAFADDKDDRLKVKISARANWGLVRSGIHLGNALRENSRIFGGEGGGHNIAAGARIPREKIDEFLRNMNETFKAQTARKL